MFETGEKIQIFDSDAIVLACNESEILLYFKKGNIKWVEKSLLKLIQFT